MNQHEAAAKNAKMKLVALGKAYDKTFEVRRRLPEVAKRCQPITPRIIKAAPPTAKSKTWLRVNRWTQTTSVASNAGRAIGSGRAANVSSMFGRPLARTEG